MVSRNAFLAALYNLYLFCHARELEKLKGLQYYFPENVRCNSTYYESEDFSDSSPHHIFEYGQCKEFKKSVIYKFLTVLNQ